MHLPRFVPFFSRLAVIAAISLMYGSSSEVTAGTYQNSAHGGLNGTGTPLDRPSLPGTIASGNCAHCHEQHASIGGSEPAPVAGPSKYLLLDDLDNTAGNAACNYCHSSSASQGEDNIASQITKTYHHDPFSALGSVLCNDCHDSHVAQKTNHQEAVDGNTIPATSPLLAVAGVSATWGAPGAPAFGAEAFTNPGLTNIDPATREYELCIKCHFGQAGYTLTDLRGQFHPANYAVHPVATETNPTWTNAWLAAPQVPSPLNATWTANLNAEMYCSDCHGSETPTDPVGPHGSTQQYLLKYPGPAAGVLDNLCLNCHNPVASSAWVDPAPVPGPANPNLGMIGDHTLPQHQYPANPAGCLACHGNGVGGGMVSNIHGANYLWPFAGANPGVPSRFFLLPHPQAPGPFILQNFYVLPGADVRGNRKCVSACHALDGGLGVGYWY